MKPQRIQGTSAWPRHAQTTGAASALRRSKRGAEEKEKKTHPLSEVCGARPLRPYVSHVSLIGCRPRSGHRDRGTRRWQRRDEDVAHLRRAFKTGRILDSMHLQFLTSDELAPVVDSNSSRDSTGGTVDTFEKKKKKKKMLNVQVKQWGESILFCKCAPVLGFKRPMLHT